jgi:Tfp pilus assembly protein PilE
MQRRASGLTLIELLVVGLPLVLIGGAVLALLTRAWQNHEAVLLQNLVQRQARAALDLACDTLRNVTYWNQQGVAATTDDYGSVLRAQTRLPDGSSDFFTLRRLANGTLSRRSTVATAQSSVGNITLFRIDYLTRTRSSDGTPRFAIVENLRNDPDRNLTDRRVDGVCSAVVTVTASRPGSWGVSYQCTLRSVVKVRNQSYTLAPPSA